MQDMSLDHVVGLNGSGAGMRKIHREILETIDFDKRLVLDKPEDIETIRALMLKPPLHSVVAWIDPCVAKQVLRLFNEGNRPVSEPSVDYLIQEHIDGAFTLTGDTLKFTKERLIDGQYRLTAAIRVDKGFETHMVFGLDESVFKVLDRQRTRTPGDILAIAGVKNYNYMAAAVRWVVMMDEGRRGSTGRGLNNSKIEEKATGPMKNLGRYATIADEIRKAYGAPQALTGALLFMIERGGSRTLAEQFAAEWLTGNRNYTRNRAFDVLQLRLKKLANEHNGTVNNHVRAAMMIQTFNFWHAGVAPSPKGIAWIKSYQFPKLAFDALAFRRERDARQAADTSLPATQDKLLKVLGNLRDKEGNIEYAYPVLAAKSGIPLRQIGYVLKSMQESGLVHNSRKTITDKDGVARPAIWRIKEEGENRLKAA